MVTYFSYYRSHAVTLLIAIAACCGLPIANPSSVNSCEMLVVKNADLKPYQDVIRGMKDSGKCVIRELKLKEDESVEKVLQHPTDVVIAIGTTAFRKVRTIKDLPVVYTMVMPTETARSLPPNISGVSMNVSPEATLSAIKEVFPKAKRIGLIFDPQHSAAFVDEAVQAARTAGLDLVVKQVQTPAEVPGGVDSLRDRMDVFWMLPDPTVVSAETTDYLLRFSFEHNVPVFSFSKKYVDMGAVAALELDLYAMGVQVGEIASKLAEGGTGPVRVYARKTRLLINPKVAAKMGLMIQDAALNQVKNDE